MAKDDITNLQEAMIGQVKKKYPKLPEWLDSKDTTEGNAVIMVDKRTGNEKRVGLCDLHGFLDGILFASAPKEKPRKQ